MGRLFPMHNARWPVRLAAAGLMGAVSCLSGCATLKKELRIAMDMDPVALERNLAQEMTEADKLKARELDKQIMEKYKETPHLTMKSDVENILRKLIPVTHEKGLKPIVRVLGDKQANAFVTGGEYVYVFDGLMSRMRSEDELAGILAHELSHLDAGHISRRALPVQLAQWAIQLAKKDSSGWAELAVTLGAVAGLNTYSREHEREADILGAIYTYRAGYDPSRFADFFEDLEKRVKPEKQEKENKLRLAEAETQQALAAFGENSPEHLEAGSKLEETRREYGRFLSEEYYFFGTHPGTADRVKTIRAMSEYLKGNRTLESLTESVTIQKVLIVLDRLEKREQADPHAQEGQAHEEAGEWQEAVNQYEKALQIFPDHAKAWAGLARAHVEQGLEDQALSEFEHAAAIDANLLEAQEGLGYLYAQRGRAEEAIQCLRRAAWLNKAKIHYVLGNLYRDQGQRGPAIRQYRRALRLQPDHAQARQALSELGP